MRNLIEIVRMMERAAVAQKRRPRVELATEDGARVVLTLAGGMSKRPGTVNVTDGRAFGENTWYGRVAVDGAVEPGRDMTPEVRALLDRLADDPARVAGQHGVATGRCCFCGRELSTRESRTVGYGPDCAGKYGLPWGETGAADEADREARAPVELSDAEVLRALVGELAERDPRTAARLALIAGRLERLEAEARL